MQADPLFQPVTSNASKEPSGDRPDRLILWPLLVICGAYVVMFVADILADQIDHDAIALLKFVVVLLVLLPILVTLIVLAIVSLAKRRPRRAVSLIATILLFPAMNVFAGEHWLSIAAGRVRLSLSKASYEAKLPPQNPDGTPILARFDWLERGWWEAPIELVFDASDEIALPQGQQSSAWAARAATDSIYACKFSAYRLDGHFYEVYFDC